MEKKLRRCDFKISEPSTEYDIKKYGYTIYIAKRENLDQRFVAMGFNVVWQSTGYNFPTEQQAKDCVKQILNGELPPRKEK